MIKYLGTHQLKTDIIIVSDELKDNARDGSGEKVGLAKV